MSFDDFDDDNEGPGLDGIAVGGALVLVAGTVALVNNFISGNKEGHCSSCNKPIKNKNLHKMSMKELEKICGESKVPDEIVKKYADKEMCPTCRTVFAICIKDELKELDRKKQQEELEKLEKMKEEKRKQDELEKLKREELEKIKKLRQEELERLKVPCLRCNNKFLKDQDLSYIVYELPNYWTIKIDSDKQLCEECIIVIETQKYEEAERKINDDNMFHSIKHLGRWKSNIDDTSSKKDVSSDYYENQDDAKKELCIRAYQEGFDVVINGRFDRITESDGNFKYALWKATGDFAKWKKY